MFVNKNYFFGNIKCLSDYLFKGAIEYKFHLKLNFITKFQTNLTTFAYASLSLLVSVT